MGVVGVDMLGVQCIDVGIDVGFLVMDIYCFDGGDVVWLVLVSVGL